MNRIFVAMIAITALALSGCGEGAQTLAAGKGMVKIVTKPGDAKIFINGKRKGSSPAKPGQTFAIKLPEGEYVVEATKQTGGRDEWYGKKEIFVAEDAMQTVDLEMVKRPSPDFMAKLKAKFGGRVIEPEMVKIPGGSFRMGCVSGKVCSSDEKPVHRVTVSGFYMGKTEVTFDQWDACVADGGCTHYPNDRGWGRGKRPVINVSWKDAQTFIKWLSRKTGQTWRLPTEAEWEYAARAGSTTKYSWGNSVGNNKANCDGCGSQWDNKKTAPVGSFSANRFGLHDMHGNVGEWVHDWKGKYSSGSQTDPKGPKKGSGRVYRGGSWNYDARGLRSAGRDFSSPGFRDDDLGFRLLRQP